MLFWLGVTVGGVGLLFGGSQTSIAAYFTLRDEAALAGPVYGTMAVGSAVMGLLSTRLPARFSPSARVAVFGFGSAAVTPLLTVAGDAPSMAAACLLIGLAVGPVLIAAFAGAERIAPPERISTVLTVLSTALVVGVATGSALAGQVVDAHSPSAAAWIAVAGAGLAAISGLASGSGPRRGSQPEGARDVV